MATDPAKIYAARLTFLRDVIEASNALQSDSAGIIPRDRIPEEANRLHQRIEQVAGETLDSLVHTYIGGNFGRDPDEYEMAELERLALLGASKQYLVIERGVSPQGVKDELLQAGALRHFRCPDGEDCPVCSERGARSTLNEVLDALMADPIHGIAGGSPNTLHASMLAWLATYGDGAPGSIWGLAGLHGPFDGPDASLTRWGTRRSQIVLDDGMGKRKALIQCQFEGAPAIDELEEMRRALSSKVPSLRHDGLVNWIIFTLGRLRSVTETGWKVVTVDDVADAIGQGQAAEDPAANAYIRYLGLLASVRDNVALVRKHGQLELSSDRIRELKKSHVLTVVEMAEDLVDSVST